MALLIVALVAYGFSRTIVENLIRPPVPGPLVLYVHAAVFFGWVALCVTQAALIRARNVRLHRRLGLAELALGLAIRTLHPAYRLGVPLIVAAQIATMFAFLGAAPTWLRIADWLIGGNAAAASVVRP